MEGPAEIDEILEWESDDHETGSDFDDDLNADDLGSDLDDDDNAIDEYDSEIDFDGFHTDADELKPAQPNSPAPTNKDEDLRFISDMVYDHISVDKCTAIDARHIYFCIDSIRHYLTDYKFFISPQFMVSAIRIDC